MIILGPDELTDVPLAWPVDSSTVLARGTITSYMQDQVRTPDGHLITREYLKHPGAVGVIALDDHDRVAYALWDAASMTPSCTPSNRVPRGVVTLRYRVLLASVAIRDPK